jgi:NitT/TauT family transport system ATP-binding protein
MTVQSEGTERGGRPTAAPEPATIEVRDLCKTYDSSRGPVVALQNATFSVRKGEFVSLVGPSGCGKSTLLHIAAGLIDHTSGDVLVGGTPPKSGRRDIGLMLQKPVLFPWRTVLKNVLLPAEILKLDKEESTRRALALLKTVGLEDFDDKYPWELSGGMRQRVSLVQALVSDAPMLFMDEPFSAVDEFTRERLNCELTSLHENLGRTTLYVTHNIQEAVFLSDRIVTMKPRPGEVVEIIDIDLPRPRRLEMLEDDHTAHLIGRVRQALARHGEEH